jgi:hypothetical protein
LDDLEASALVEVESGVVGIHGKAEGCLTGVGG